MAKSKSSRSRRRAHTALRHAAEPRRCGRYELLELLGTGGMAEVYRARVTGPSGFCRHVVLKRLLAANKGDEEFVNMFIDEARILGMLHHQNVVQALDFGEEEGQRFLVLEYVEGPSLMRVMQNREAVPAAIVAYVGRELCRALDYVHGVADTDGTSLGLVHRDVTPSNVIVTPTGAVKLLDFGIAKFAKATQSTRAGTVKGKAAYVAPEQLRSGSVVDGRVDLFALGTVMHELLSGERLFASDTDLGTMQRILEMKIPVPSSKQPGIPAALDRVVMRALERDPKRRYATAAEMGRDLDAALGATGFTLEAVTDFMRDAQRERRAPLAAGGPVAAVVASTREHQAPTRRDLRMPVRMWIDAMPSARRTALVAGFSLALGAAGAFGLGSRLMSREGYAAPASRARPSARECQVAGFSPPSAPLAASTDIQASAL